MCTKMMGWQLAGCSYKCFRWFDFFFLKSDHRTQGCSGDSSPAGPFPTGRACRGGSAEGGMWGNTRAQYGPWQAHGQGSQSWQPWVLPHWAKSLVSSSQQPCNLDAVSVPISQMRMLKLINLSTSPKTGAEWAVEKTSHVSLCSTVSGFLQRTHHGDLHLHLPPSCDSFSILQRPSQTPSARVSLMSSGKVTFSLLSVPFASYRILIIVWNTSQIAPNAMEWSQNVTVIWNREGLSTSR